MAEGNPIRDTAEAEDDQKGWPWETGLPERPIFLWETGLRFRSGANYKRAGRQQLRTRPTGRVIDFAAEPAIYSGKCSR